MNHPQHLVLLGLLLGLAAIVSTGPVLSDKQNSNDAAEKPLQGKSEIEGNVPDMVSSGMSTKIDEKGVITLLQETADKLGSILGNKKKKPVTTPSPYKGDSDPKPMTEAHQASKIHHSEEETDVNSNSLLATNPASNVSGKIGLGGLVGGSVATALQAGSTISETGGNVLDEKATGLGNLLGLGSASSVNKAPSAAGSHASNK